jgi:hypothetical protein
MCLCFPPLHPNEPGGELTIRVAADSLRRTWHTETVQNSEKNLEQVIEKMAAAARALGWPEQIVDATRSQIQTVTKTQIQMMDRMMDAWEEQIKSPKVGNVVQAKVLVWFRELASGYLAKCR